MKTSIAFLLHTHMPYVRKNGDWPVGEEWLLEAWAETYIPLLELLRVMSAEGWGRLSITLTPILAEQLEDPYLQGRLQEYLENKLRQCEDERVRLEGLGDGPRREVNRLHFAFYDRLLECWGARYRGRMIETLRTLRETRRLEIITSAATHAFLPLLAGDAERMRQARLGLEDYWERFGESSRGFWLPECAFSSGMEDFARALGAETDYVVLDYSALEAGGDTALPRRLGEDGPGVLLRDARLHDVVWNLDGLPSHAPYREFHKRDREGLGFQYWRISAPGTPLDDKQPYRRAEALAQVEEDAAFFVKCLEERAAQLADPEGSLLLACYDTEIFGHWWFEGMEWLGATLRLLDAHPGFELCTPGDYFDKVKNSELPVLLPACTTWGRDHDFSTWENPETEGMWEGLHRCETEYLATAASIWAEGGDDRPLRQALRELLLLESSDWPYMVGRDEGRGYARDRFHYHRERFDHCLRLARERREDERLREIEEQDNPFADLELT